MSETFTVQAGPHFVNLFAERDVIGRQKAAGETFEPQTLAAWAGICAKGGTALDVGGYSGLFSIAAAMAGARPICFEPMPSHAKRCRENAALNGVEIDIRGVCVSDRCGHAQIKFNPKVPWLTSGASLIRPSGGKVHEVAFQPAQAVTIDSLNLGQCTAIKIDVERGEPLVLAGAVETLARCRPALIVEVLGPQEKCAVLEVVSGYRVAREMDIRNWLMLPE